MQLNDEKLMKGNVKDIVAKIKPETSIEEIISYCDTVEDFDELFREYVNLQGEECNESISELIFAEYQRQQEGLLLSREVMEKYRNQKKYKN